MRVPPSPFTARLAELNALRLARWVLDPGMSFQCAEQWWAGRGPRRRRHNGIDLRFYESEAGRRGTLAAGTAVPILYDGRIVAAFKDFLGATVIAAHGILSGEARLFTLYGHVEPAPGCVVGAELPEGAPIASLAGAEGRSVPAHLHLSVASIPRSLEPAGFSWKMLDEAAAVRFLDPAPLIGVRREGECVSDRRG